MTEPEQVERIVSTKKCIRYWESVLFYHKPFLEISVAVIIKATIHHLKEEK